MTASGLSPLGLRSCEWSLCDAAALNGQNTSTVKMATSEPVRETRANRKNPLIFTEIPHTSPAIRDDFVT